MFLISCLQKQASLTNILCGPDEDDVKAESWCVECEDFLCEKCCQNHKKYKALQGHQIYPITIHRLDLSKSLKKRRNSCIGLWCKTREKKKKKFLCKTHQTGCCSACDVKEHKNCEGFDTLSEAADMFTDEQKLKLVEELNVHLSRIETIIQNEKQNISDFDDKTDTFSNMIKKMIEEMVNRLKTKEKTYIDQMAEISKDARQKLERSLKLLEQRKMYLAH